MANDFRNFSVACDRFTAKLKLAPITVQKKIAFDLFKRIIEKTPVDTGRARGSWTIAGGEANRAVLPPAPAGHHGQHYPAPVAPLNLRINAGEAIWISNNLPYITALEDGHSKRQAPHGMVALSIQEMRIMMGALIAEGARDVGL